MKSIQSKLFIQIGCLVTLMIGLLLIVNTLLAESYYMNKQQDQMITYYYEIVNLDVHDDKDAITFYENIELSQGIEVLVLNDEEKVIYASEDYINDDRVTNLHQGPLPNITIETLGVLEDGTLLTKTTEENFGIESILLSSQLEDHTVIELRMTVHYIQAAIDTINEILLISGIIFIIISMIFAFILARSFTKPILEINDATMKMQNLDFEIHSQVSSNDELGQLANNINHMSDISDTIETLNDRDEKRQALLNNVSHELKTPLTLMQGYAVGLQRSVVSNPEKTNFYTEVIIDETVKMNRLVESLLDIDQLETDKKSLHIRSFNIRRFVEENIKKFESLILEKEIKLTMDLGDSATVECDPDMTEQVLKNLLSNAIIHINDKKQMDVTISSNIDVVRVSIKNSCDEIDEKELEKLWDRFYKKDKARTREQGGHGLGLSIVKAIQDAHNQKCGVYTEGGNICFWFEVKKV